MVNASLQSAVHIQLQLMLTLFMWLSCHVTAAIWQWQRKVTRMLLQEFAHLHICFQQVRRADVTSAWSGIRPLAIDPKATDTASALRDHIVLKDDDGLITVTGEPAATKLDYLCDASPVPHFTSHGLGMRDAEIFPLSGCSRGCVAQRKRG